MECSAAVVAVELAGQDVSIVGQITAVADRQPNQLALVDGATRLTFAELDRQSNQLARLLMEHGVGREICVGLLLDRSASFVISALAVLKAGGAYVPMDAATPADRVAFTLSDAGAVVLISHRHKAETLPPGDWHVIDLDDAASTIASCSPEPIQAEYRSDDLAYVVYTSGSTGRPKGVEITHANVLNLIHWHNTSFGVTSTDRATQIGGLGFDVTAWEIWPHLTAGASVHIASEEIRRSPQALRDWMVMEKITVSFAPTVLAEQLIQLPWPAGTSLRWLLTGGESLLRRPPRTLPFKLVNNYGPAECTVVSTFATVAPEAPGAAVPSIGLAISNATALILDETLNAVAHGEAGELCLSGALVGRGYRNNPQMTTERFVSYSGADGQTMRVYRTGDRARFLPDGEIAFLGRFDDQVNLRGYRIELGEIGSWLAQYPGVSGCAAMVRNIDDVPEIVAYLLFAGETIPTAAQLREYLVAHVPQYMLPARYFRLDALPITPNGKIDRAALPAPSSQNTIAETAACASATTPAAAGPPPSADVESRINAMVAGLLEVPSVKNTDNFFMLGGHSMLGVQLVAKIRDAFGVKLTLRQLFSAPTVNALSAAVNRLVVAAPAVNKGSN